MCCLLRWTPPLSGLFRGSWEPVQPLTFHLSCQAGYIKRPTNQSKSRVGRCWRDEEDVTDVSQAAVEMCQPQPFFLREGHACPSLPSPEPRDSLTLDV